MSRPSQLDLLSRSLKYLKQFNRDIINSGEYLPSLVKLLADVQDEIIDPQPTLSSIQTEIFEWGEEQFEGQPPHQLFFGIVEELGELAHAQLKFEQGIRYTPAEAKRKRRDAVGDIMVFFLGWCHRHDIDVWETLSEVWVEVRTREWKRDPINGHMLRNEDIHNE